MAIVSAAAAQDATHEAPMRAEPMGASVEHAGKHEGAFPPFETENFAPQLVWLVLTFGVLYVLMSRLALPRVARILDDRETRISSDLDASREMQTKAHQAAEQNDANLRARRAEAQAIAHDAHQRTAGETAARRAAVEADFNGKLKAADERIAVAKTQALSHVGSIAKEAAAAILEKLTGERVDQSTLDGDYRSVTTH